MPKLHILTVQKINRIKPLVKDVMYNDGGGLYLFIRSYGTKEWVFRYTSPITQSRRKQTLGVYPDKSLADARVLAGKNRDLLKQAIDPIIQAQRDLEIEIAEYNNNKRKAQQTVELCFDAWKKAELLKRKDFGYDVEMRFKKDVFPETGLMPLDQVDRPDIQRILDRPLKRKANRCANILMTDLKQFFRFAEDEGLININPTRKFIKPRVGGKERKRKRVLRLEELLLLNDKLAVSNISQIYKHALCLYLATGCRRNELLTANLKFIHEQTKTLYIPSDKSKNTDEHNVYLSDFALRQIRAIRKLAPSKTWLFPNDTDDNHLSEGAITRNINLRQPYQEKKGKLKPKKTYTDEFELPLGHWTLHDLRRTASTIMQEKGIAPHVVKMCLNQRIDDAIQETYQLAELNEEQKDAFVKLGEYLSQIFYDI